MMYTTKKWTNQGQTGSPDSGDPSGHVLVDTPLIKGHQSLLAWRTGPLGGTTADSVRGYPVSQERQIFRNVRVDGDFFTAEARKRFESAIFHRTP